MLIGKHRGRHEHRSLLVVGRSLERGAYGYLRLAETHVTAYQTVHRPRRLHIGLHGLGSRKLVRGVLIYERCLQLMLHIAVRRELESLLLPAA